jgi:hypothetical protein
MDSVWATSIMRSLLHQCHPGRDARGSDQDKEAHDCKGGLTSPELHVPAFLGIHDDVFAAHHSLRLGQEFPTNADRVNESTKKIFLEQEENAKDMVCAAPDASGSFGFISCTQAFILLCSHWLMKYHVKADFEPLFNVNAPSMSSQSV